MELNRLVWWYWASGLIHHYSIILLLRQHRLVELLAHHLGLLLSWLALLMRLRRLACCLAIALELHDSGALRSWYVLHHWHHLAILGRHSLILEIASPGTGWLPALLCKQLTILHRYAILEFLKLMLGLHGGRDVNAIWISNPCSC